MVWENRRTRQNMTDSEGVVAEWTPGRVSIDERKQDAA